MRHWFWFVFVLTIFIAPSTTAQLQQSSSSGPWQTYDTSNGEWRSYAGDIGGTKYSPLAQINADNFSDLKLVWEWTSVQGGCSPCPGARESPWGRQEFVKRPT